MPPSGPGKGVSRASACIDTILISMVHVRATRTKNSVEGVVG